MIKQPPRPNNPISTRNLCGRVIEDRGRSGFSLYLVAAKWRHQWRGIAVIDRNFDYISVRSRLSLRVVDGRAMAQKKRTGPGPSKTSFVLRYKYLVIVVCFLLLVQAYLAFTFFNTDIHPAESYQQEDGGSPARESDSRQVSWSITAYQFHFKYFLFVSVCISIDLLLHYHQSLALFRPLCGSTP